MTYSSSEIKDILGVTISMCDAYPYKIGYAGIFQHPLYLNHILVDEETGDLSRLDEETFKARKSEVYRKMEERFRKSPKIVILMTFIQKPYRLLLLELIEPYISKEDFSTHLILLWTDTEFPHQNGIMTMISMFRRADRNLLMTKDERAVYDTLPDRFTVYRGLQSRAVKRGLSWTINLHKAEWFADRFRRKGVILTAKISKDRIYAYKEGLGEAEIILNPRYLKDVKLLDRSD